MMATALILKNISRAAERVGIGQPPLSLQIRDMEREVGTRLFHRFLRPGSTGTEGLQTRMMQLVAAEMGVCLVSAALRQVQMKGVTFKELHDIKAMDRVALAWRRSDTSQFVKNFIAIAIA